MASVFGQAPPAGGWDDTTGSGDATEYILSTTIDIGVDGQVTGVYYFVPSTLPTITNFAVGLTDVTSGASSGTILHSEAATKPVSGEIGTWKLYTFSTPVDVTAGMRVQACVRTNRYVLKSFLFNGSSVVNGDLTAIANDDINDFPNGAFTTTLGTLIGNVPDQQFDQSFYGIDLEFTAAGGGTDATATPTAVAGTTTIGTPTITASSTPTPSTVAGVATIATPTVKTDSTVTPSTVAAVATVPTPTVGTGTTATPATVQGTASVPTPGLSTGSTATPATVAGVASIPTPTVETGTFATATPSTVAGTTTVGTPTVQTGSTATPAAVGAVASIPTPTIQTGSTATPATVTAVASIGTPNLNPVGAWFLWDAASRTEIPLTLEGVWNGETIDALTFDEVTA